MRKQVASRGLLALILLVLIPAAAWAQASIAGVVKDASGAVLPGVTVEAASPALIEKARTVVSGTSGQYRIVDLRPGTYTVTFSLSGFSTVKREGLELSGSGTATIDADLRVGAIEETMTVTGLGAHGGRPERAAAARAVQRGHRHTADAAAPRSTSPC